MFGSAASRPKVNCLTPRHAAKLQQSWFHILSGSWDLSDGKPPENASTVREKRKVSQSSGVFSALMWQKIIWSRDRNSCLNSDLLQMLLAPSRKSFCCKLWSRRSSWGRFHAPGHWSVTDPFEPHKDPHKEPQTCGCFPSAGRAGLVPPDRASPARPAESGDTDDKKC